MRTSQIYAGIKSAQVYQSLSRERAPHPQGTCFPMWRRYTALCIAERRPRKVKIPKIASQRVAVPTRSVYGAVAVAGTGAAGEDKVMLEVRSQGYQLCDE